MYLLIEEGQFARNGLLETISNDQQDYWFMYESNSILNARCTGTDMTASGKQFQCLTALCKTKPVLLLLLRVLPICRSSIFSPGLQESLAFELFPGFFGCLIVSYLLFSGKM